MGAEEASNAAARAEAEELMAASRAAQRNAIMASRSAKTAVDQAHMAVAIAKVKPAPPLLPPCTPALLQVAGDCEPVGPAVPEPAVVATGAQPVRSETQTEAPSRSDGSSDVTAALTPGNAEAVADALEPEIPSVNNDMAGAMAHAVAENLARNPNSVNAAETFDASTVPVVQQVRQLSLSPDSIPLAQDVLASSGFLGLQKF